MKKWNAKKWICFGALLLNYLPLLCLLLPVYVFTENSDVPPAYWRVDAYLSASSPSRLVFFLVSYILFFLLITLAAFFFIRAIRAESDTGDAEDKNYVFGFVSFIAGNAILAMTMFGQGNYIPMGWSLLYVVVGISMIVLHFRKLSSF